MDKLDKLLQEWTKRQKPGEVKLRRLIETICRKVKYIEHKKPEKLKK